MHKHQNTIINPNNPISRNNLILSQSQRQTANSLNHHDFTIPITYSSKRLQHINCIIEPNHNQGGLFIGDIISTVKPGILESARIGAILACSYDEKYFKTQARTDYRAQQKIIDTHDSMEYPIKMHFDTCYEYIENQRNNKKNVLVHCHAGVSRSGTIVIAYLIKKKKWKVDEALSFVRSKRERVKPNQNFIKQLQQYERQILKNNTYQDKPLSSIKNLRQKNIDSSIYQTSNKRNIEKNTVQHPNSGLKVLLNNKMLSSSNEWTPPIHYYNNPIQLGFSRNYMEFSRQTPLTDSSIKEDIQHSLNCSRNVPQTRTNNNQFNNSKISFSNLKNNSSFRGIINPELNQSFSKGLINSRNIY